GTNLPGTLVAERVNQGFTGDPSFVINLTSSVGLGGGTYWVTVQANQNFTPAGQWGWTDRTVQSNQGAAWQNPGGGFGICPSWGRRATTCNIDPGVPDQVYRLRGTTGPPPPPPPPGPPPPPPPPPPGAFYTITTQTGQPIIP